MSVVVKFSLFFSLAVQLSTSSQKMDKIKNIMKSKKKRLLTSDLGNLDIDRLITHVIDNRVTNGGGVSGRPLTERTQVPA